MGNQYWTIVKSTTNKRQDGQKHIIFHHVIVQTYH